MPADFEMCVKNGGKVRTKRMSKSTYAHMCILNGKVHMGETKKYKKILGKIHG